MFIPRTLVSRQLTTSNVVLYTTPGNCQAQVGKLSFANGSTTTTIKVSIYKVPAGDTAGVSNLLSPPRPVSPGEAWDCTLAVGHLLQPGMTLQAKDDTGSAVTVSGKMLEFPAL